jgi:hypothetical protein
VEGKMADYDELKERMRIEQLKRMEEQLRQNSQPQTPTLTDDELAEIKLTISKLESDVYILVDDLNIGKPKSTNENITNEQKEKDKRLSEKLKQQKELFKKTLSSFKEISDKRAKASEAYEKSVTKIKETLSNSLGKTKEKLENIGKGLTTTTLPTLKNFAKRRKEFTKIFTDGLCRTWGKLKQTASEIKTEALAQFSDIVSSQTGEVYNKTMKTFDRAGETVGGFLDKTVGNFLKFFGGPGKLVYKALSGVAKFGWKIFKWVVQAGVFIIDKAWKIVKGLATIGWKAIRGIFEAFSETGKAITKILFETLLEIFSSPLVIWGLGIALVAFGPKLLAGAGELIGKIISGAWNLISDLISSGWDSIASMLGMENGAELNQEIGNFFSGIWEWITEGGLSNFWDKSLGRLFGVSSEEMEDIGRSGLDHLGNFVDKVFSFIGLAEREKLFIQIDKILKVSQVFFNYFSSGDAAREFELAFFSGGNTQGSTLQFQLQELEQTEIIMFNEVLPEIHSLALNIVTRQMAQHYLQMVNDVFSNPENRSQYLSELISVGNRTLTQFLNTFEFGGNPLRSDMKDEIKINVRALAMEIFGHTREDIGYRLNRINAALSGTRAVIDNMERALSLGDTRGFSVTRDSLLSSYGDFSIEGGGHSVRTRFINMSIGNATLRRLGEERARELESAINEQYEQLESLETIDQQSREAIETMIGELHSYTNESVANVSSGIRWPLTTGRMVRFARMTSEEIDRELLGSSEIPQQTQALRELTSVLAGIRTAQTIEEFNSQIQRAMGVMDRARITRQINVADLLIQLSNLNQQFNFDMSTISIEDGENIPDYVGASPYKDLFLNYFIPAIRSGLTYENNPEAIERMFNESFHRNVLAARSFNLSDAFIMRQMDMLFESDAWETGNLRSELRHMTADANIRRRTAQERMFTDSGGTSIDALALGGVIKDALLAWVGEGEHSEVVIPINKEGWLFIINSMDELIDSDTFSEEIKEEVSRDIINVISAASTPEENDTTMYDLKNLSMGLLGAE